MRCVAGVHEVAGFEADPAGAVLEAPEGVDRDVVPLPDEREVAVAGLAVELVGGDALRDGGVLHVDRERGQGLAVAVGADHRPAVFPGHGDEERDASDAAAVAEEHGVPFSVRGVDEAALGDAFAREDHFGFIGAFDLVGAGAEDAADVRPADVDQVVLAVDQVHLGAFEQAAGVSGVAVGVGAGDEDLVLDASVGVDAEAAFLDGGEVGGQLDDLAVAAVPDDVVAAVLVKHEGVVVEARERGDAFPVALRRVLAGPDVGLVRGLGEGGDVERAVLVADAARPGAVAVFVLAVGEREAVLHVLGQVVVEQVVVAVADDLPVHQVLGHHHGHARVHVHGGAGHVVGVAHAEDGDVGDVRPDDGVEGGLLAVVDGGRGVVGRGACRGAAADGCERQKSEGVFHNEPFCLLLRL